MVFVKVVLNCFAILIVFNTLSKNIQEMYLKFL